MHNIPQHHLLRFLQGRNLDAFGHDFIANAIAGNNGDLQGVGIVVGAQSVLVNLADLTCQLPQMNLAGCMDPKASNYKSYYVHRDDSGCRFR